MKERNGGLFFATNGNYCVKVLIMSGYSCFWGKTDFLKF